jgi:hypothetical protein
MFHTRQTRKDQIMRFFGMITTSVIFTWLFMLMFVLA